MRKPSYLPLSLLLSLSSWMVCKVGVVYASERCVKHIISMGFLQLQALLLVTVFSGSMSTVQGNEIALRVRCVALMSSVFFSFRVFYADCGTSVRRSRQPRVGALGRIIHGRQSVRGAWPWQVN